MAFMGVFTGAGFASGQEIMQYFTSFGLWGIAGAIIATILFGFVGMVLLDLGSHYNATTHTDVFNEITNKTISRIIDVALMITIFGIGVVMLAGACSNLNQQFGLPVWLGSSALGILLILIGMMDTEKVISAISSITPFFDYLCISDQWVYTFIYGLFFSRIRSNSKKSIINSSTLGSECCELCRI